MISLAAGADAPLHDCTKDARQATWSACSWGPPSSWRFQTGLHDCKVGRAGNVCSPSLPRIASRCTPREETRDGAFWMKRLFVRACWRCGWCRGWRDGDGDVPRARNIRSGSGPGRGQRWTM